MVPLVDNPLIVSATLHNPREIIPNFYYWAQIPAPKSATLLKYLHWAFISIRLRSNPLDPNLVSPQDDEAKISLLIVTVGSYAW